jgi:hypothetical protein
MHPVFLKKWAIKTPERKSVPVIPMSVRRK